MVMLTFSVLHWKYPFWANFVQKNQNYLYKLKFGTECNLSILNPIIIFTFWYTNVFKYAEFDDDDVYFFCFGPEIHFSEILVPNYQRFIKCLLNLFNFIYYVQFLF